MMWMPCHRTTTFVWWRRRLFVLLLLPLPLLHGQPLYGIFDALDKIYVQPWRWRDGITRPARTWHHHHQHQQYTQQEDDRRQPLRIIGAGLPRTGTGSLHEALELLGYKTYHMVKVMASSHHAEVWAQYLNYSSSSSPLSSIQQPQQNQPQNHKNDIIRYNEDGSVSNNNNNDIDDDAPNRRTIKDRYLQDLWNLLADEGYNATLDWPASDLFHLAYQQYPEAKVILTVRTNVTHWARSFQALMQLDQMLDLPFTWTFPHLVPLLWPTYAKHMHQIRCGMGQHVLQLPPCRLTHDYRHGYCDNNNKNDTTKQEHCGRLLESIPPVEWLEAMYHAQIKAVQAVVPPENLLIYNAQQGWGPLCQFLNVSVPPRDIPFPHVGGTALAYKIMWTSRVINYSWIPCTPCLLGWLLYTVVTRGCRTRRQNTGKQKIE